MTTRLSILVPRMPLAIALTAAFVLAHPVARAVEPPAMAVSPATANVTPGNDVALDITAANIPAVPGLGGYLILLQWNPSVLTLTSLTDTGWVSSGQIIVVCTAPTINNVLGNASADCTPLFGFGNGVSTSAPHALAHAVFHAVAPGTTGIDLTGSELLDPSGVTMPNTTLTGGSVTVSAPVAVGGVAEPPVLSAPKPASEGSGPPAVYAVAIAAAVALLAFGSRLAWRARRRP